MKSVSKNEPRITKCGRGSSEDRPEAEPGSPVIVFLVHGTWAREAPWTRHKSTFQTRLSCELGKLAERSGRAVSLVYQCLDWNGRNNHKARREATKVFADGLAGSIARNPGVPHFIVAHSHGGNIAAHALRDENVLEEVRGVVCMGTPFLHVHRERFPQPIRMPVLAFCAGLTFFVGRELLRALRGEMVLEIVGLGLATVVLLSIFLLFTLLTGVGMFSRRVESHVNRLVTELAFPPLTPERFVALRISGDEAATGLVASQFFAWLFRGLTSGLHTLLRCRDRFRERLHPILGLILVVLLLVSAIGLLPNSWAVAAKDTLVTLFLLLITIPFIIVSTLGTAVVVLLILMHFPFGTGALLSSLSVQITAEPSPPGTATVFHVSPETGTTQTALRHSQIYEDPRSVRFIAHWIGERLGLKPIDDAVAAKDDSDCEDGSELCQ